MIRVAIDTNIIVAGSFKPNSASRKVIELCIEGKLLPVFSERSRRENQNILARVKPSVEYWQKIYNFFGQAIWVNPTARVDICTDKSDNKYFEAAIAGDAKYIISNDRHLLEHDGYMGVRVMRPSQFLRDVVDKEG